MYCAYCGSRIGSGYHYCPECGADLTQEENPFEDAFDSSKKRSAGSYSYARDREPYPGGASRQEEYRNRDDAYGQPDYSGMQNVPPMSFGEAIRTCFTKYVDFSGRARRSEYWYFVLLNVIVCTACNLLGLAVLNALYSLAVLLPGLAVAVRRLHDTGRSGLMILLILIPFAGAIILLVWFCADSESGSNQYGPNPKSGM